ncbi:hypothetical protein [Deefgea rivuli]|uniref:hypothetical protein n=1 Tax=Deefgea rivuli TaxID=400948 RepID=UPI0012EC5DE0|nr:hypothetical protein [Deefgea rivuli]
MRMYQLLTAITLALLSVSSLAKHHDCKEFKNEQARQNCREHHDDKKHNCYDSKNNKTKEKCRNDGNYYGNGDKNDKMYRPDQQHRTKSQKEAQQFCASAHSALDHDACMSGQGYPKR